jgi:hypothetical protein
MGWRVTLVAAVAVVAMVGVALASAGGGSTLTLCAARGDGALRLAGKSGKCGKGERQLTISRVGPTGATGPQGPPGPAGPREKPEPPRPPQPGAVQPVAEAGTEVPAAYCEEHPGTFCWNGALNWVDRNEGRAPVGFQKDAEGYVHLRGSARVTSGVGPEPAAIFFLPPGDRPTEGSRLFPGGECPIELTTAGAVKASCGAASLDGVDFYP